jgi:UDP:flavonoid glycosyltransferase YjiC (YdhE family)
MRVLVTSTPGYGHVLPMVPLALALQARGHTVLWATSADACTRVRAVGLTAAEAGLTEADIAPVRADMRRSLAGLRPEELPTVVFPVLFGETRTPPMLEALLPLAREWRPDLVVHEQGELAGPLVGTLLGVPHAVHAFGGGIPASILANTSDRLATLWSQHGEQIPPYAGCYQHLYLDICPTSLQTVPLDHVGAVQAARPELWSDADPAAVPSLLPEDHGRPLVYVTLGTVSSSADVLGPAVRAVADLDVRVLATVGPGGDPAALGPQPAHVRVERWVPQVAVLAHCAAVVSHGGSGTVLAAAALGLPQVSLPQAADQFRNTTGLVRAGGGIGLHPDQATGPAIAAAVHDVQTRPELRAGAGRLRDEIAAMPAPDAVVTRLEQLSPG